MPRATRAVAAAGWHGDIRATPRAAVPDLYLQYTANLSSTYFYNLHTDDILSQLFLRDICSSIRAIPMKICLSELCFRDRFFDLLEILPIVKLFRNYFPKFTRHL